MGDPIRVKVARVDLDQRQIDFVLADQPITARDGKKKKSHKPEKKEKKKKDKSAKKPRSKKKPRRPKRK